MANSTEHKAESESVRALLDRRDIEDLLKCYAEGVRKNDVGIIASVFADDAVLDFPRGVVEGIDKIRSYFEGGLGADKAKRRGLDAILDATPLILNVDIDLFDDSAHCECMCISLTLALRDGEKVVGIIAQRVIDEVVRTSAGWRICRRKRIGLWDAEGPVNSSFDGM